MCNEELKESKLPYNLIQNSRVSKHISPLHITLSKTDVHRFFTKPELGVGAAVM